MTKTEQLCAEYALNRKELRTNKNRTVEIVMPEGFPDKELIDRIQEARKDYIYSHECFLGWEECFEESMLMEDKIFCELARLWDRRREIKQEVGNIKRKIYIEGARLNKEQTHG